MAPRHKSVETKYMEERDEVLGALTTDGAVTFA